MQSVSIKITALGNIIFDPAQKNPKLRIVFLIFNFVYLLLALLLIIIGAVVSVSIKSYNYLPPILAAAGLFLLFTIPFGLYGIFYPSAQEHHRFIAIQLYLFLTLFLSLALIMLGGFHIVFYPSLKAKVSLRWDVFIDVVNPDKKCSENEKSVDKFCGFLRAGGIMGTLCGVVLLTAPILIMFLIGWKLYLNSMYIIGSGLMIITGIFMIAVGIYLILSYAIKAQARFTMPNSGPAIYMMIGCGILPVVVGVFGIILGFQKNPISSTILFIFEISLVLVIILLIATAGYFIGTYTKTSEVQIRAYLRVNKAWVKQIMVLRTCFLNNTVCDVDTCASDKEEVDEDSESEQYRTLLAWLVQCFSSRVKADFFLCGFAGLLVGIYAFLMGGSFAIELLIGFCRNLGKPEVEEQEYSVEEDDESVRPSSEIEMEEVEEKEKEKETEDNMKH